MPKVRKPRRGRGGADEPPEYDDEHKQSPPYDRAPPPPYHDEVDENRWNYPGSNRQFPPPAYPPHPDMQERNGIYYVPGQVPDNIPGLEDEPFDEASPEEQRILEELAQVREDLQRYARIRNHNPRWRTAELDAAIQRAQAEHNRLVNELNQMAPHWDDQEMGGGRVVNAHAKKTGALMRKHKMSLGQASSLAALHSRNAKTKARGGSRRGNSQRSVPKSQKRASR